MEKLLWETKRLKMRLWEPARDAIAAHQIYGDPAVMEFIREPSPNLATTVNTLQRYRDLTLQGNQGTGTWAVIEKDRAQPIGTILLVELANNDGDRTTGKFEIGWHFRKASWGQGFAFEAATYLLNHGFKALKLPMIYAVLRQENRRSHRLAERLQMHCLGKTQDFYNTELLLFGLEAKNFTGWDDAR